MQPSAVEPPRVRVGLLGAGRWGSNYVRTLLDLEGVELAAVFDPSALARARLREAHGGRVALAGSVSEVLETVEAVVVATPPETHAALAIEALRLGRHVLVEKPFATTEADALALTRAARESRGRLLVGHLTLHHPAVGAALTIARSRLGEVRASVHRRTSRGAAHSAESPLWALGPHDVALALRLHGAPPEAVSARLRPTGGGAPRVEATARFANGATSTLLLSRSAEVPERTTIVTGTHATLGLDEAAGVVVLGGRRMPTAAADESPLLRQCRHFLRCARGAARAIEGAAEGLAVTRVLGAMQRSLEREGEWQTLPSASATSPLAGP